jgi:hypothetical protein
VYAAKPDDLNDPFEYSAPVRLDLGEVRRQFIEEYAPKVGISPEQATKECNSSSDDGILKVFGAGLSQIRKDSGVICFSAVPNSIRMWSYYAKSHQGICLGFDTSLGAFSAAMKVTYQNPDQPLELLGALRADPSEIGGHISLRKAAEWEFEQEYRIPIGLIGERSRAMPYPAAALVEIRIGVRIAVEFKRKLMDIIRQLEHRPKIIEMGCDFDRCVLTERVVAG